MKNDMLFKEIVASLAQNVEGFLTLREGRMLYKLASLCAKEGAIVEIGSYKGKSTIWIAEGTKKANRCHIFAIDPHDKCIVDPGKNSLEEFMHNIKEARVDNLITPIVKTSKEARQQFKNSPISFLFIDGSHEYSEVRLDYELWSPLVVEEGYIAFHDSQWPGVKEALKAIIPREPLKNIYFTDSLVIAQKVSRLTRYSRLKNRTMLFLNEQFQTINASRTPRALKKIQKNIIKISRDLVFLI
jgi:predicted O-methyltransferase YrrM